MSNPKGKSAAHRSFSKKKNPAIDRLNTRQHTSVGLAAEARVANSDRGLTAVASVGRQAKAGNVNRKGKSVTGGAAMGGMNIRGAGGIGKSKPKNVETITKKYKKQVSSDRKAAAKERASMRSKGMKYETVQSFGQFLEKTCWKGYKRKPGTKKFAPGSCVKEEGYDRMRDDRLVKYGIGHDGSDKKPSKRTPDNKKIKGKTVLQKETEKKYGKGKSALDIVKAKITAKHGKGAIMKNEEVISELSSDTLQKASKAADIDRGKKAVAGDKEGAKKRVKQASRFFKAASSKRKEEAKEGTAYGITKGDGKAKGVMKDYLDKKAKKLSDEKKKQKPEYKNNPAFGDASHHSNAKSKNEEYTVTNADKKGNTPAYQGYKAGKKNAKTGKPLYKAADHMKEDGTRPHPDGQWEYHEKEGLRTFKDFMQEGNPTTRMLSKSKSQQTGNISADRGTDSKKNKESRKGLEKDLKKKGIGYKKGTGEYKYDDGSKGREVSYQTTPAKGMSKRRFGKTMRRLGRKHGQESVITKDKNKPARLHDTESKKPGKSVNIGKSKPGKHPSGQGETSGTKVRGKKLSKTTNKPSYHYG